ncbi:MAG: hypothetical protein CVU39_13030 [Chloroflexi bacterium HGW-Chloroflexi-10]|nr:MAG: hypothetical protein CVU39_13030 [Chloroflexi bacterium HGW-Chloroflexi-10]
MRDETNSLPPTIQEQRIENNLLHLEIDLPPGSQVDLTLRTLDENGQPTRSEKLQYEASLFHSQHLPLYIKPGHSKPQILLFILALAVYLAIRLIAIEQFPIYFFTDEAIQTVHAIDLINENFREEGKELLPTYFVNGGQYNLGTSVYIQILPTLLFGRHIWVTRVTAVLFTLLAALAVGLTLQNIYCRKSGWLGILLLSLMPAWFLHSRTAFETGLAVSFYAMFLYCYLLYRYRNPRWFIAAALCAALAFYSYSPAQMVVAITLAGILFSDLRYHWQQRKIVLFTLGVGLLLLIPYIRFLVNHPEENARHLEILQSYWVQDLSLVEKMEIYFKQYFRGLNPLYWFLPNQIDLPRHTMSEYGHLWRPAFVFVVIGLGYCLRHIRESHSRLILLAVLAAPTGAALAELGVTRALFMVIPATLLAALGIFTVFGFLQKHLTFATQHPQFFRFAGAITLMVVMVTANFAMLRDALTNGPFWHLDYSMFGMQYGASQVFGEIATDLQKDPDLDILLSSAWANGTDILARFFFGNELPFEIGGIEGYIREYIPVDRNRIFILLPHEREEMFKSAKFQNITTEKTINYPNGEPGFYFTRLEYVDNIQEVFAAELAARRQLILGEATLQDGTIAQVKYSTMDMGEIKHIFDGDIFTLARTWESNPFRIQIQFPAPRYVETVQLRIGGEATRVEITLYNSDDNQRPFVMAEEIGETPDPRNFLISLPEALLITKAEVRVFNLNNAEPAHVHLWEVEFFPPVTNAGN